MHNKSTTLNAFDVYVRVRPLNTMERQQQKRPQRTLLIQSKTSLAIQGIENRICGKEEKLFNFDGIFPEESTNESIYNEIMPNCINNLLSGYNTTLLAYGMTGAGKTYTMFGDI